MLDTPVCYPITDTEIQCHSPCSGSLGSTDFHVAFPIFMEKHYQKSQSLGKEDYKLHESRSDWVYWRGKCLWTSLWTPFSASSTDHTFLPHIILLLRCSNQRDPHNKSSTFIPELVLSLSFRFWTCPRCFGPLVSLQNSLDTVLQDWTQKRICLLIWLARKIYD